VKIQVQQVLGGSGECWQVAFRTTLGPAVGEWRGPCPLQHDVLDVELDIGDALEWGRNVRYVAPQTPPGLHVRDGRTIVVAPAAIAADGLVTMRLDGALLMLDVAGDPPREKGALLGVATARLAVCDSTT
jgi:hypothetical protein